MRGLIRYFVTDEKINQHHKLKKSLHYISLFSMMLFVFAASMLTLNLLFWIVTHAFIGELFVIESIFVLISLYYSVFGVTYTTPYQK